MPAWDGFSFPANAQDNNLRLELKMVIALTYHRQTRSEDEMFLVGVLFIYTTNILNLKEDLFFYWKMLPYNS